MIPVEMCSEQHVHHQVEPNHTELDATCDVRIRPIEELETENAETENAALLDG